MTPKSFIIFYLNRLILHSLSPIDFTILNFLIERKWFHVFAIRLFHLALDFRWVIVISLLKYYLVIHFKQLFLIVTFSFSLFLFLAKSISFLFSFANSCQEYSIHYTLNHLIWWQFYMLNHLICIHFKERSLNYFYLLPFLLQTIQIPYQGRSLIHYLKEHS